ncbi:response regulator [Amnibacterium sp.]|uniref:response regulator n=1 Tax=Amnibacterium sp. TaxID=1872496 RepID=UPI003F7BD2EB
MIRLVLADDHPLVREGIRAMLATNSDIDVVAVASSGPEAVALARSERPDLVLMDLRMPGGDGVEATRRIVAESLARVVILTTYDTDEDILRAIEAGASGYLLKDVGAAELARSVRAAAEGQTVLARPAADALLGSLRGPGPAAAPVLSVQEVNVLRLASRGATNARIGAELHISETTVKTYLRRAFEKLGAADRTAAVRRAIELGVI